MNSILNINGKEYDMKLIEDRSKVLQIIENAMKGCDEDYFKLEGDFKLEVQE